MNINTLINHLVNEFEVQSILCYGSYAQTLHDNKSDIDLLLLMKNSLPTSMARQDCYRKLPNLSIVSLDVNLADRWDVSWSPLNDQLLWDKQAIDIGFNTISWVKIVIEKLIIENQITFDEFPFRPYTFLGLLETAKIFYDENNFITQCLAQIRPIPSRLKNAIIQSFLPVLKESYVELIDYSARDIGILAYEFQLFRGLDAVISILFVINEIYDPASKRTEAFLFKLNKQPPGLSAFINNILPRFYEHKKETMQFFAECINYIENNID